MNREGLSDLDELVILCRSLAGRTYISEAASCYKAGAYRAAIVATWVALVFDFLAKLRELEMSGDANAKKKLEDFENARASANFKAALEFERNLIDYAQKEFELISPMEASDLRRLFDDRNRCAHPSMSSTHEPYNPSAELARTSIRNAVVYVLQHPPVQGKAAFDRIMGDIHSEYFPEDFRQAIEFFKTGPLARARLPLVRSLIIVLLKEILGQKLAHSARARLFSALNALLEMYVAEGETTLANVLPELIASQPDTKFYRVLFMLGSVGKAWEFIGKAARIKVMNYVANAGEVETHRSLPYALRVPALKDVGLKRLESVPQNTIARVIRMGPSADYIPLAMPRFRSACSFRDAESLCETLIIPLAPFLTPSDIGAVAEAFKKNFQITHANRIPKLLEELFDQTEAIAHTARSSWKSLFDQISDPEQFPQCAGLVEKLKKYFEF